MRDARGLDRLFAVRPRDFTRARNALVAELRAANDAEGVRSVVRLRRPSATLWAVNQLARHTRPALDRFLEAVDRLRRTQLSDPRGAAEAMRAERAQLETLVARAGQTLEEAGYTASSEARRRIGDTLLGATASRAHAEALRHGRLTEELQAPGFDALAGAATLRVLEGGVRQRERAAERGREATARSERRREAAAARERQRRSRAEERAREEEARARAARERAEEVVALEREATAARERLAEIQRRLSASRRAAKSARRRPG
jgi:hypothetical protein